MGMAPVNKLLVSTALLSSYDLVSGYRIPDYRSGDHRLPKGLEVVQVCTRKGHVSYVRNNSHKTRIKFLDCRKLERRRRKV